MTAASRTLSLPIQGVRGTSCVSHSKGALNESPSVAGVAVDLATNQASLIYDLTRVTMADMVRAFDPGPWHRLAGQRERRLAR